VTSGALVLPALGAIGLVIWYSMLQDLPAEGGADGRCRRSVAGAGGIAASHGSGDGGWREGCDGHELSSPIDGMGHCRGWQPGSKISMMTYARRSKDKCSTGCLGKDCWCRCFVCSTWPAGLPTSICRRGWGSFLG
jgi:hypothetical protein